MSKLWITGDWHFQHKNICTGTSKWDDKSGCRQFDTTEEMDDLVIDNTNSKVMPEDTIWNVGDVLFGDKDNLPNLMSRIKCRNIHLLYGNHDECISGIGFKKSNTARKERAAKFQKLFVSVGHYHEMFYKGKLIVMFHYPLAVWHGNGKGAIHLFGHSHGSYNSIGRMMDVGVDNLNYYPMELDTAIDMLETMPVALVDHHDENTSL